MYLFSTSSHGTYTCIELEWDESPGADGYNIYRSDVPGGPYSLISYNYGGIRYEDLDLVVGSQYYYVVTAFNDFGESPHSREAHGYALEPNESAAPTVAPSPSPVPEDVAAVTVYITGEGKVYSSPAGEYIYSSNSPGVIYYPNGRTISLSAIAPEEEPCGYNCQQPMFLFWEGDITSAEPYISDIVLDGDMAVTAFFQNFEPGPTQNPSVTPFPDMTVSPDYTPVPEPTPIPEDTPTPPAPTPTQNTEPTVTPTVNPVSTPTPEPGSTIMPTIGPTDPPPPTPEITGSPTAVPGIITGDVNGDKSINIIDALLTAQYYVGLNPAVFIQEAADVNCDGKVNIVDALLIAQYYVGFDVVFC